MLLIEPESILSGDFPRSDLHNHTNLTDGRFSIDDCIEQAIKLGLDTLGFSEHVSKNNIWMNTWFSSLFFSSLF